MPGYFGLRGDQTGDDRLAGRVVGMGLAREQQMQRPSAQQRLEPRLVAEDQIAALVAGRAARDADHERVRIETLSACAASTSEPSSARSV